MIYIYEYTNEQGYMYLRLHIYVHLCASEHLHECAYKYLCVYVFVFMCVGVPLFSTSFLHLPALISVLTKFSASVSLWLAN